MTDIMNVFDNIRKQKFKLEIAKMYSRVLGISNDDFVAKLSNSFNFDYMDLLVLKLLEDAGFDMNKIGTYIFGFIAKEQFVSILGASGSDISKEIRAQGCEMLINLGFNSIVSCSRKTLAQFNSSSPMKLQKNAMKFEEFKELLNESIRTSYYGAEGFAECENAIFISFIRDIIDKKSSFANFDETRLNRGRKPLV